MNRAEIEAKVTDAIIASLEAGVAPWKKGWISRPNPTNVVSGRPYRGINWWTLAIVADKKGYDSPYWLTYKQATERGGQVRKGEKGTAIVFWKIAHWQDAEGDDRSAPLLRYYTVFNADQCDGLTVPDVPMRTDVNVADIAAARDHVLNVWRATGNSIPKFLDAVGTIGDTPHYSPTLDYIMLPDDDRFHTVDDYVGALLHEAAHSTGHESRLHRWDGKRHEFGCNDYAEEELVAEIGAAMIAARLGLPISMDNSAAYVASWLKRLKDDRALLIAAAQRAQKATDWICGDALVPAAV
jgi:antirestriction protein ArdC